MAATTRGVEFFVVQRMGEVILSSFYLLLFINVVYFVNFEFLEKLLNLLNVNN